MLDNDLAITEIPYAETKLVNLHELIVDLKLEAEQRGIPTENVNFRLDQDTKTEAQRILAANGVTFSDFLRKCCEQLVDDYT